MAEGKRHGGRVTSTDVAAAAGVSRATVSYVLNDVESQRISPATRDRVLAAAERLGYVPHAAATSLRAGRTSLVLLGLPGWPLGPPLAEAVSALMQEVERLGYTALAHLEQSGDRAAFARACERARPVGVIAPAADLTPDRVARLRSGGTTAVFALARTPLDHLPTFAFDQSAVGSAGLGHLAERGHRRVLALAPASGPLEELGRERLAGARRAAGERGVALSAAQAACTVADVGAALRDRLAGPEAPTAVLAFNDEYALAALAALGEAGIAVPGDVAVIGCDDSPAARLVRPRLTTIRLVEAGLWRAVAGELHAMIGGADATSLVAAPSVVTGVTT